MNIVKRKFSFGVFRGESIAMTGFAPKNITALANENLRKDLLVADL